MGPVGPWRQLGGEPFLGQERLTTEITENKDSSQRRHCERSEAIQGGKSLDCFVALLLAMTRSSSP
jgi:hypothetical protein